MTSCLTMSGIAASSVACFLAHVTFAADAPRGRKTAADPALGRRCARRLGQCRRRHPNDHDLPSRRRQSIRRLHCRLPRRRIRWARRFTEGQPVAEWLNTLGVTGVVLKYRLGPKYHHPVELGDVSRGDSHGSRERGKVESRSEARSACSGFSAGGHLASTIATHFDDGDAAAVTTRRANEFAARPGDPHLSRYQL